MSALAEAAGHAHHRHDGTRMRCCAHHEIEASERNIVWYLVFGLLVFVTFVCKRLDLIQPPIVDIPAVLGAIGLGWPMLRAAWQETKRMRPSSSTLAAVAILAAFAYQKYETAGVLAFILLVADQIVRRTATGAQRAIEELVGLTPDTARVVEEGQEREVPLEQVAVGMVVRVRPGENLPVDGQVSSGRSTINQASLTGEAMPVEVQPGDRVFAGTENLTGALDVQATQVGLDTTIGRVSQLIGEAETARGHRQLLVEQVARFFVPVALSVAAVVWFVKSQNPATKDGAIEAAISVLIVTCPMALLLASPTAMVAAFASAARLGVLIKRTDYLEAAANIDAVVFDKTGTITTGRFEVSRLAPAAGVDGADLLRAAAEGEQHSNHPLAQSIMATARAARIEPASAGEHEEVHGRGVRSRAESSEVCVGRASWLLELKPSIEPELRAVEQRIEGMTGVHVMRDGRYLGAVGLEDKIRANTRLVIERLRELGIRQTLIYTGDRLSVAKRVGVAVGADAVEAECLPEEKHELVRDMVRSGYRTLMVGDGINDGPSLAAADVGIAMGLGGSDIAANSAGVALMTDDLSRVPFLIELARKTRLIVAQNIAASILIVIAGLVLASTGKLAIPIAALYHFAGDIFVIANSFRLFRFGENYSIGEAQPEEGPRLPRREGSLRLGQAGAG